MFSIGNYFFFFHKSRSAFSHFPCTCQTLLIFPKKNHNLIYFHFVYIKIWNIFHFIAAAERFCLFSFGKAKNSVFQLKVENFIDKLSNFRTLLILYIFCICTFLSAKWKTTIQTNRNKRKVKCLF